MKKPLSKSLRTFFGMGNFGYQILANIETAFFAIFLTDTVQFPIYLVGIILMATSISDFIIAPLSGAIINGSKAMKWGRIRSWLLVAPPFVIIFYLLQFSNFGNGVTQAVIVILGYILSHAIWNMAFTADIAIIAEIAPNNQDRLLLNSRRMLYNNLGRMFSSYFTPLILVYFTAKFGSENNAYVGLIICASVVMCLSFWADFKTTKGYENKDAQAADCKDRNQLSAKEIVNALIKNPPLFAVLVADLSSNVGSFLLPALATYYYKYVAQNIGLLKYHLFLVSFGGLLGAYASGYLFKKIYKKKVLLIIYFAITSTLLLSRLFAFRTFVFMGLQMIMQFFVGMSQPMEADLYMDTATYHEWKSGKNASSFIMGLLSIPLKISVILKGIILTVTFLAVGYTAGSAATPEVQNAIVNAYVIVPASLPMIGAISLGFFFKLNPARIASMQKEINERKVSI